MTPGARIQATIELLDAILSSWRSEKRLPADKLMDNYFKSRRYIGSKDRAAIGELSYWVLRHKAAVEWHIGGMPPNGRALALASLMLRGDYNAHSVQGIFSGTKYAPPPLSKQEKELCGRLAGKPIEHKDMPTHVRLNYPEWLHPQIKQAFGGKLETAMRTLNDQAPLDLRVNTLKTTRDDLQKNLRAEGFDVIPTPHSPIGLRLHKRAPIFTSQYFKQGHFEVQDEGSQLVALLVNAQPGMKVIDFCAGAGGKTLAMAATMQNKGRILAWDNSEKRLKQIVPRLKRAGVHNVQTHLLTSERDAFIKRHKASAHRVLIDAPCSGTGTWRRNPDLKWRFSPADLEEILTLQQAILESASRLVIPGGRLIYVTCSLLESENERQLERFLSNGNDFRVVSFRKIWDKSSVAEACQGPTLTIAPHQDGTDGFFAAVLERQPEKSQTEA